MTMQLLMNWAAVCLTIAAAPAAVDEGVPQARRAAKKTTVAADADGVKPAAPRPSSPTWFEGRSLSWISDRLKTEEVAPSVASDQTGRIPRLGPLDDETLGEDVASPVQASPVQYDGAIVALTDDVAGYDPADPTYSGYGGQPYDLHLMPQGLIYRSYMAGAKESRFRSVWHEEQGGHSIWDITLGGNVGILRYGTRGDNRPEGVQLGIEGAGLVRLDRDSQIDVAATDYRFGIPITWGDSIYQVKFAYYHLSSHVGDEFLLANAGFQRVNYSRDALVWGHSLYPTDKLRVYGEIGYAFYVDVCDPWELQFGVDYGPNGRTGARGAPFAAINAHLREEVDFGGNLVAQAGWAWRRSPATGMYRLGVEYYNGKDDQFSFFNQSVEKIGLGMWYDY